MVTFVCHYCDVTLKKKQLENHTYQCGRPPMFICIDCSQTFVGNDYTKHTSCMTEQQKYHGQYAKKTKQQINHENQLKNQQKQLEMKQKQIIEEEKEPSKVEVAKDNNETNPNWSGWKKTIRKIVKNHPKEQIKLRKLREMTCLKYKECHPSCDIKEIEKLFNEKISSNPKLQEIHEPYIKLSS